MNILVNRDGYPLTKDIPLKKLMEFVRQFGIVATIQGYISARKFGVEYVSPEGGKLRAAARAANIKNKIMNESIFIHSGDVIEGTHFIRCHFINNEAVDRFHLKNCVFEECQYYYNGKEVPTILDLFGQKVAVEVTNSSLHV